MRDSLFCSCPGLMALYGACTRHRGMRGAAGHKRAFIDSERKGRFLFSPHEVGQRKTNRSESINKCTLPRPRKTTPFFKSFLVAVWDLWLCMGVAVGGGFQRTGCSLDSPRSIFFANVGGDLLKIDRGGIGSPPTPQGE